MQALKREISSLKWDIYQLARCSNKPRTCSIIFSLGFPNMKVSNPWGYPIYPFFRYPHDLGNLQTCSDLLHRHLDETKEGREATGLDEAMLRCCSCFLFRTSCLYNIYIYIDNIYIYIICIYNYTYNSTQEEGTRFSSHQLQRSNRPLR